MMICFNCSTDTRDELDRLVTLGGYRDYAEAIAIAVRNQLMMEQQVESVGAIVVDSARDSPQLAPPPPATPAKAAEPRPPNPTAKASPPAAAAKIAARVSPRPTVKSKTTPKTPTANGRKATTPPRQQPEPEPEPTGPATIPKTFLLAGVPDAPPEWLAGLGTDMWAPGQTVPLERWMLGQQNRLLPAKVNSRALIRMYIDRGQALPLSQTAEQLAKEAARLGDFLAALDAERGSPKDDALATAFPTTGEDTEKSRTRYANQFVVYENSRGELSGLMADLKLINFALHKKERLIVPTKMAWLLARVENPIIDNPTEQSKSKFSAEERILLVDHIVRSVPVEAFAYRAVLEAVQAGHNSPERIDAALKQYVTPDRAASLSQSFLASQRSGAVSRMSDLNLIERQRNGTRVSYAVTVEGQAFLAQCPTALK